MRGDTAWNEEGSPAWESKGARAGHPEVAAAPDAGAGAGKHEQQKQQQGHTGRGGQAMDPADARPGGEQQFPKPEGAGLGLSLEHWRQAQDELFPLHPSFGGPAPPHQTPTQVEASIQTTG